MKNDLVVRKHNDMIEACFKMSVPEMRLILSCVAQINFNQIIDKDQPFYIEASEYAEIFGVDTKNVYREIKKAVDDLWNSEITIQRENSKPLDTRWIQSKAEFGDGGAEIHFADSVIPYLTELHKKGNFTIYKLQNVGGLKSIYGIRLYELLIQYKKIGERKIELKELRDMFCLGTKYTKMSNFKTKVLDVAIKEINLSTDIRVSYENIKRGRSIVALNFKIKGLRMPKKKNLLKYIEPEPKVGESQAQFDTRKRHFRKSVVEEQLDLLK